MAIISIIKNKEEDYICLTENVKAKEADNRSLEVLKIKSNEFKRTV